MSLKPPAITLLRLGRITYEEYRITKAVEKANFLQRHNHELKEAYSHYLDQTMKKDLKDDQD
jgi:hypothetical protein